MQKHGSTKHEIATVNSDHFKLFHVVRVCRVGKGPENQARVI